MMKERSTNKTMDGVIGFDYVEQLAWVPWMQYRRRQTVSSSILGFDGHIAMAGFNGVPCFVGFGLVLRHEYCGHRSPIVLVAC